MIRAPSSVGRVSPRRAGRRLALLASLFACAATALAQPTAMPMIPGRAGYAFGWPGVLAQQRVFGLAHGIGLLAAACTARKDEAAIAAYGKWRERQHEVVDRSRRELSLYYFGTDEHDGSAVAAALRLKPTLGAAEKKVIAAACASLSEVLDKPRYDLGLFLQVQRQLARLSAAGIVQGRGDTCLASSEPELFARLSQRLEDWHRRFDAELIQARSELAQRWQDADLGTTLEAWLDAQAKRGRKDAGDCAAFADWLSSAKADPDDKFLRRP